MAEESLRELGARLTRFGETMIPGEKDLSEGVE